MTSNYSSDDDPVALLVPDAQAVIDHKITTLADAMEIAHQRTRVLEDLDPDPYGYATELEHQFGMDLITPNWKAKPDDDKWVKRFKSRARKAAVAKLFLQGHSVSEIATKVEVAAITVHRDLQSLSREWRRSYIDDIEELAAKDLARLDYLLTKLAQGIEAGDTKAINSAIEIIKERGAILGYRQGIQVDIEQYVREVAEANGYDPERAVQLAQRISITMK